MTNSLGHKTTTSAATVPESQTTTFPAIDPQWAGHDQLLLPSLFFASVSNSEPTRKIQICSLNQLYLMPCFSFSSKSFPMPATSNQVKPEAFPFFSAIKVSRFPVHL